MKTQFLRNPFSEEEWVQLLSKAIKEGQIDIKYGSDIKIDLAKLILNDYTAKRPIPKIMIMPAAFIKMMSLVQHSSQEIAWHGIVEKTERELVITDIMMYPQTATAATVDADEDTYSNWIVQNHKIINKIRMQGHSHVNMSCFASGTDSDSFKKLLTQVKDFYIFLIVNKRWEMKAYYADVESGLLYEDVPISLATRTPLNLEEWRTEQMKMLKTKSYTYPQNYSNPSVSANPPQAKKTTYPYNDYDDAMDSPLNKKYRRD